MPRGGKRLGAGRKPHTRRERWLDGNAGKRSIALVTPDKLPPATVSTADAEPIEAPAVLTPAEVAYWDLWAPSAKARGLLTEETRHGLVLLCQTARRAAEMWGDISSRGMVFEKVTVDGAGQEHHEYKAHPLLSHWRALMARMEQLQARYGLAADGKVAGEGVEPDEEEARLDRLMSIR